MHVIEGDVPSWSDLHIHEHIGVKFPCLHASSSREHIKLGDFPTGHIHFPLQVELHVACLGVSFCMKSVYSKTSSRSSSGTRDRVNHACESGHSTGLPGAARFPSKRGRLGCKLCGSTCTCQMLFSLSFPNLLWFFVLSEQKGFPSQKTQHFFLHIAFNACTKIRNVLLFSLLLLSLMSSKALVLAFRYLLVCESFVSLFDGGKFIKSIFLPHKRI